MVAASLKDKTVSFCTLKKHTHTAKINEVIRLDDATIARYTPLMGWRLSTYEKIAMIMEIGMDSSDSSWDIQKVGLEVLEDHMSLWIAMLQRTFPALSFSTVRHQVLYVFFREAKTTERYKTLSTGFKDTLRSSGKLFLSIHCEPQEGHAEGHWTLLVIEAKGKITYYETMTEESEGCLKRAKEFVEAVDMNPDLVVRENKFRQTGPGS